MAAGLPFRSATSRPAEQPSVTPSRNRSGRQQTARVSQLRRREKTSAREASGRETLAKAARFHTLVSLTPDITLCSIRPAL